MAQKQGFSSTEFYFTTYDSGKNFLKTFYHQHHISHFMTSTQKNPSLLFMTEKEFSSAPFLFPYYYVFS